ncbi:TPA: hypothetical protein R4350_001915 [Pasteurella multocida]|uniref:hypothetical protein n=1 Tax=Pasteurella multocida TaxID=747 RepID=UPI000F707430|nr:hypothetical protein [Pasteurella multocida]MEB3484056.1 hypothetical protein [Pasteurella multocida]MEB3495127.1 hypothetical protein [Pasteurella multocida]VEI58865.1 Uncharacterised protein [Pasteurella multocida]HDR0968567.1 hypothetical protein [Pasteurella multocida]HDR0970287.1 hypothetical protein [Pasteurella multocida]
MECLAQKEQELLQNEINSTFISLYDLCNMMKSVRLISNGELSNAASIILTRIKFFLSKNPQGTVGCWLKSKMINAFDLRLLENKELIDELNYIIANNKYSGVLKSKRMAIFRYIMGEEALSLLPKKKNDIYLNSLIKAFNLSNNIIDGVDKKELDVLKIFSIKKVNANNEQSATINYTSETLREFIELIIDPALLENNGQIPTYSRLHSKLQNKYRNKRITSKNTIKKYLNDL